LLQGGIADSENTASKRCLEMRGNDKVSGFMECSPHLVPFLDLRQIRLFHLRTG
jgi:hypothetical protein